MKKLIHFIKTSLIGGVMVLAPICGVLFLAHWFFMLVTDLIQPITDFVIHKTALAEIVSDFIVIIVIIFISFIAGTILTTTLGKYIYNIAEKYLLARFPGYSFIKDILGFFLGSKGSPFNKVGIAKLFGNDTRVICFITTEPDDKDYRSIFVPTGPNPTSGNIYLVKSNQIEVMENLSVEETMKIIVGCGSGSEKIIDLISIKNE